MSRGRFELMDEFSGMPLPISPVYAANRPSRYPEDEHHPWHDRQNPLLRDLGGKALRVSRVQGVNYDAHHLDYHGANLLPVLPVTDVERIRPIILAVAGYVPKYAITFTSRGTPNRIPQSEKIRMQLWQSGKIRVGSTTPVRKFLCEYVLQQDLSDLSSATIDEFLYTTDEQRKWELGNSFLGRASRRAAEPIESVYQEAYKAQLIPNNRGQNASRFILGYLGLKKQRPRLFGELETKLAA